MAKVIVKPLRTGGTVPPKAASVGIRMTPESAPAAASEGGGDSPRDITVFVDGVDSGLLPQDVTEIYLGTEEGCLVLLDHNGATPVGSGEFESGTLGNCVSTDVTLAGGDVFATIPECTDAVDATIECRESPATPHLVLSDGSGELGAVDLSGLLPDITLIINGVTVGTISRCANEVSIIVTGECVLTDETCEGSGSITVEDDQGGSYTEVFTC